MLLLGVSKNHPQFAFEQALKWCQTLVFKRKFQMALLMLQKHHD